MTTTTPDPIDVAVGARIRTVRELRRMSQTALGKAIGVSFQQVQKYEGGRNRISCSALVRAAQALETPAAQFLPGTGEVRPLVDPLYHALTRLGPKGKRIVDELVHKLEAEGL